MKTRKIIWAIGSLLLCALLTLGGQYILNDCVWWECVPERDFHVLDWELPANLFPSDANLTPISPSSEGAGEKERGSQNIYWDKGNGLAIYKISRYSTRRAAVQAYEFKMEQLIDDVSQLPWTRPSEIAFSSVTADDMVIGCGYWSVWRCGMVARYQEYVIFFNTVIDEKMTYAEFEKVAFYLDEQISIRLYP